VLLRTAKFTFHAWINPCSVFATFATERNLGSGAEMRPLIFNQRLLVLKFDLSPMKIEGKCQFEKSDVAVNEQFCTLDNWFYPLGSFIVRSITIWFIGILSWWQFLIKKLLTIRTNKKKCILRASVWLATMYTSLLILITTN